MAGPHWFEVDRARLVLEHVRMRASYPGFDLSMVAGHLVWTGEVNDPPAGANPPVLRLQLTYDAAHPVVGPEVVVLSPSIPDGVQGHEWHRLPSGKLCLAKDESWHPSYTAADAIAKATDWYYNFVAVVFDLAKAMPDVGRADIAPRDTEPACD